MNTFDLVILIVVGIFGVKGLFRGVVLELLTLVGLIAGYVVALREMNLISGFIIKMIPLPIVVANTLAFLICFVGIALLFRWLASLFKLAIKGTLLKGVDHVGGLCIGLMKGAIVISIAALLINLLPLPQSLNKPKETSYLYKPALTIAPFVYRLIGDVFPYTKDFYKKWKTGVEDKAEEMKNQIISDQLQQLPETLNPGSQIDSLVQEMQHALP